MFSAKVDEPPVSAVEQPILQPTPISQLQQSTTNSSQLTAVPVHQSLGLTGSSSSSGDTGLGTCPPVDPSQALPFLTPTPMRASVTPSVVPEWLLIYFRAPEKFDHYLDWNSFDLSTLMAYDAMLGEVLKAELNEVTTMYERYQGALYRHYYMRAQGGSNRSVVLNSQSDINSGTSLSTSIDEKCQAALGGLLSSSDTQVNRLSPSPQQRQIATVVRHLSSGNADYRMSLGGGNNSRPAYLGPSRLSVGNYVNPHYSALAAANNRRPRSSFFVSPQMGSGSDVGAQSTAPRSSRGYENIAQIIAQERHRIQQLPQSYMPRQSEPPPNTAPIAAGGAPASAMLPPPPPLPTRFSATADCQQAVRGVECNCPRCSNLLHGPFSFDELAGVLPATGNGSFLPRRTIPEVGRLPPSPLVSNPGNNGNVAVTTTTNDAPPHPAAAQPGSKDST